MHILVINDDGPPSTHSSPYVHSLVRELQAHGHRVSVCLPHSQRSWIGKAHMIGQTVKPVYYRPPQPPAPPAGLDRREGEPDNEGSIHTRPWSGGAKDDKAPEEWVLVDGTPASCAQIGLYHVFPERGPIDLVLSGPNYGRNTTAVFALSSGTLGGALEAAACGFKSIALSYAFFSRNHDRDIIAETTRHAIRVVEALVRQWPADSSVVDLYSVNVPLVQGVSTHRTVWAGTLQNYWRSGSCFVSIEAGEGTSSEAAIPSNVIAAGDDDAEEERIREGADGEAQGTDKDHEKQHHGAIAHRHFKWQPRFADVYKSVDEAPPGNDGWAVKEGFTSVTPLKANFQQTLTEKHLQDLQFGQEIEDQLAATSLNDQDTNKNKDIYALVAYEDPYVQPILVQAIQSLVPANRLHLSTQLPAAATADSDDPVSLDQFLRDQHAPPDATVLQITPYEALDFDYAAAHTRSTLINSYVFRKALIRKHFLAGTVALWTAKRPASVLRRHVQPSEAFEVDYAEFLDDALVEAFDLRASLEKNAALGEEDTSKHDWWILKPSMSDRGQGIRLFSTMEELQEIFDGWEEESDEEDEDEEDGEDEKEDDDDDKEDNKKGEKDNIMTSHLRHFVAQPYIHPPLLLPGTGNRKFHIRVYVLCVGALKVYVYRDMLALFAAKPYSPPWENDAVDLDAHLTNTCLQDEADKGDSVLRFWDLPVGSPSSSSSSFSPSSSPPPPAPPSILDNIFQQICTVTGELFEAAAVGVPLHFQPLPNAFEVYGLDFLVTAGSHDSDDDANDANDDNDDNDNHTAYLLEVNAFPDFRQTGTALQTLVAQFWTDALRLAVQPMVDDDSTMPPDTPNMVLVKDIGLGRR